MREKFDVSENLNHYKLDGIRYKLRENMSTRKGHIGLDARISSCTKISTFTVCLIFGWCVCLTSGQLFRVLSRLPHGKAFQL